MKLFELPNTSWQSLIYSAMMSEEVLQEREKMKNFSNILRTNSRVASSLGAPYVIQLEWLYPDMLKVYKAYSGLIQRLVSTGGPHATKTADVRNMRSVKRDALRVIEAFILSNPEQDREQINSTIVDPLTEPVLGDYYSSVPESREPAVLSLFSHIVAFNKGSMSDAAITVIFKSLFGCTLDMIKNNFEDFPDARINFFLLLRAVNQHNFASLFKLDENPAAAEAEFRVVINAIVWALKHTERNVAETGLQILLELLRNVDKSLYVGYFYRMYFKSILNDILSVLTDTFHRPGFKLHAQILMHLIGAVGSGRVADPIWNQLEPEDMGLATNNGLVVPNNAVYLRNHLMKILKSAFPNLRENQVADVVKGLLSGSDEKTFKGHLRDFLVQTKEFSGGDNTDLYDEEKQAHLAEQH
jgi:exportin-1